MNKLLTMRKHKKLNQSEMSEKLGIAVSTYSLYESNKSLIPKNIALELAKIFDVDVNDIFLPIKFKILE